MVNSTFALQSYKFFNAVGDGCFATAVNTFVTSHEDRKLTVPLLAVGTVSKFISMIPFYAEEPVRETQPHPISGTSYPGLTGLISANLAALAGNTPTSKAVSKVLSLVGGVSLNYLNKTIVYDAPSTLMCANSLCIPPPKNDSFYCETSPNITESNLHRNRTHFPPNCTMSRCIATKSPIGSAGLAMLSVPSLYVGIFIVSSVALDMRRYLQVPLQSQLASRVKVSQQIRVLTKNAIWLLVPAVHLLALRYMSTYKYLYLGHSQLPFAHAPYLLSVSLMVLLKRYLSQGNLMMEVVCIFSLIRMFISIVSVESCNHPPLDVPSPQEIPSEH